MKTFYWFVVFGFFCIQFSGSQTIVLNSNQNLRLEAFAGKDTSITKGASIIIGGRPTASNGYGGYIYSWSPSINLDDPTKANPLCTSDNTTLYSVRVTDSKNCIASDEILVTVKASGIDEQKDLYNFKVFPNPSKGKLYLQINEGSGSLKLRIVGSTGQLVIENDQIIDPRQNNELDISCLKSGYYYVIVVFNGRVLAKPLILL